MTKSDELTPLAPNISVSRSAVASMLAEESQCDKAVEFYNQLRDCFIETSPELADLVGELTEGLGTVEGAKLIKAVLLTKRAVEWEVASS